MRRLPSLTAVCLLLLAAPATRGQLPAPQLQAVFPPGGARGSTFDVQITGADLDSVDQLLFSHPGITARPKLASPPAKGQPAVTLAGQFVVAITADVPSGIIDVRARGRLGVSNPRAFVVGERPEALEAADNNSREKAQPAVVSGVVNARSSGTSLDWYKLPGRRGQPLVAEVWAERIDSRMDATLVLHDATGRELAHSRDALGRDPLIDYTPEADGELLLAVFDAMYQGGNDYAYRLVVTTGPRVEFALPPCGTPSAALPITFFGQRLPGGTPVAPFAERGRAWVQWTMPVAFPAEPAAVARELGGLVRASECMLDGFDYRVETPAGSAGAITLGFASAPIVVEQEPGDRRAAPQTITPPCEFVGSFFPRGDQDMVQFAAAKGTTLWIEVISQRLGVPTDPAIVVQRVTKNAQGAENAADVAEDDDPPPIGVAGFSAAHGDPALRLQIPEDGTYRILLRDLYESHADPRHVYRLIVRAPRPDFRLVAAAVQSTPGKESKPACPVLRQGGTESLSLLAFRREGFNGPIEVTVEGLPPGVRCPGAMLGPGQSSAPLVFAAAEGAAPWAGTLRVVGRAQIDGRELVREARAGCTVWPGSAAINNNQPGGTAPARLARESWLALNGEKMPVFVELGDGATWTVVPGGKVEIPVKVTRRDGVKNPLALVPIDLPPGAKAGNNFTITADAKESKFTFDLAPDAPPGTFTFALRVQTKLSYRPEAGDPKKAADASQPKVVDASFPSTALRLNVTREPVALQLKPDAISVKRGGEVALPIAVARARNFTAAVDVELLLPAELKDAKGSPVTLAAGKNDARVVLRVGPGAAPGKYAVRVVAKTRHGNRPQQAEGTVTLTVD